MRLQAACRPAEALSRFTTCCNLTTPGPLFDQWSQLTTMTGLCADMRERMEANLATAEAGEAQQILEQQ